jgi:parallel beta-helix repeat protein
MENLNLRVSQMIFAVFTAIVCGNLAFSRNPQSNTLYVSVDGNDNWSGRLAAPNPQGTDGPLRTLLAARDNIRKARETHASVVTHSVLIRGGLYQLSEPFLLFPEDSGAIDQPISYAAFPGEYPILSGGRTISGWKEVGGGIWSTEIPEVREGKWTFHSLFVNGRRAQPARSPNYGFYRMEGPREDSKPFQLKFKSDEIKSSRSDLGDVEVVALFAWADIRMPIRKVDENSRIATLAGELVLPFDLEVNARYYIENAPEALDSSGEWYLDRKTGVLSYWPLRGEEPAKSEFVAPVLTSLVHLEGKPGEGKLVHHLQFRGLTFQDADWDIGPTGYATAQAAIEVNSTISAVGAVDCKIENCVISRVGGYALHLGEGCQHNRIIGNKIFNVGAGAVKLGVGKGGLQVEETFSFTSDAQKNRDNLIADNDIHDLGTVFPSGVGVWIGHQSFGNRVSHNHIYDTYYTAISVGWTWGYAPNECYGHKIEYNHLDHIGRDMLSDMGAIYTLGIQPGTVIRNNLIHDVSAFSYGGWGIYTDEGSSNILIENNVVYRTKHAGFNVHYGRDNVVRNNIFAFGKEAQISFSKPEDHLAFTFERNIVYWDQAVVFSGNFVSGNLWPECSVETKAEKIYAHSLSQCKHFHFDHNLYFNASQSNPVFFNGSWNEWQKLGNDIHSTIADPRFVNPSQYNFTVRPGSPALKMGFKPIDLSSVGPRSHTSSDLPQRPRKPHM